MTVTLSRRALAGILLGLGVIVLAVGLFLGFRNVSTEGIPCGSAFKPDDGGAHIAELPASGEDREGDYTVSTLTSAISECTATVDSRKPTAWATTITGAVIATGGLVLLLLPTTARRSDQL